LGWSDAHLSIFWRSLKLSILTTLACLFFGFPTAYFIATRPKKQREFWMLLIIIPFWTNLLIRTFAILELIRNEGTVNSILIA
ncbi:ABC transporter permease, partial [Sulfitobacter sp. 15WGC]